MGVTRVPCVLLLIVGACCAYPQYGGSTQEEEQVQGSAVIPETQLTPEQVAGLGEFWWQNQGVFNNQPNVGSVVVVEEQVPPSEGNPEDLVIPFTPVTSPNCDPLHGCVPWQYCVDGEFNNTGVSLLAVRTYSQVPETYTQKLCGQVGHVCCLIPAAILEVQQPGSPVDGGEIVEVVISGDGTELLEQTGGAGPYSGGNTGGVQDGTVNGGIASGPAGTVVEPAEGGEIYSDNNQDVTGVGSELISENGCLAFTQDCVPYFQCLNGEINIHGSGLIDTRIGGVSNIVTCVNPEFPEIPAQCCNIPGATVPPTSPPTPPPTPAPITTCPGNRVCVDNAQCNPDGTINTDGTGLINIRSHIPQVCYLTFVDSSDYSTGVCCEAPPTQPPTPAPLETCPVGSSCLTLGQCQAQNTNYDTSLAPTCYVQGGPAIGECCVDPITVPPTPAPLTTCSADKDCVDTSQCKSDGTINTDGTDLIDIRIVNTKKCYIDGLASTIGVCCRHPPPVTSAPLQTCPDGNICRSSEECISQSAITGTDYFENCVLDASTYTTGLCCNPPTPAPPVTPAPLQSCPGEQICVSQGDCASLSAASGSAATGYETCIFDANTYTTGICCDPPTPAPPVTPAPLQTCPGEQICVSHGECDNLSAANGGAVTDYQTCIADATTYTTGVCCNPPIRLVEVCPGQSVCLPELLCLGEILSDANEFLQYGSTATWAQCNIFDGFDAGVCCLNPEPSTTPKPTPPQYTAATQCGVRNLPIDTRISSNLEKNEAGFGEFSWQAIVFFTNFTFKCGASIIDDRWLLTAAHCVDGFNANDFKIRLGEWQVDTFDEPLKYIDFDIANIFSHPDFKPGPVHNDVALIELATSITFQYHINKVCLPDLGQIAPAYQRCFVTGWGKNAFDGSYQPVLKQVDVPVVSRQTCQNNLRKTRLGKWFRLHESFMCAGGEENKDACEGDGGGPLVCEIPETSRYYVAGITAWGIDCGTKDVPGVYVDVQLFRPWIDSIIQGEHQLQESNPQGEQQQGSNPYGRR